MTEPEANGSDEEAFDPGDGAEVLDPGDGAEAFDPGDRAEALDPGDRAEVLDPGDRAEVLDPGDRAEVLDPGDRAVEYPVDGVLDLHQFRPADAQALVGDYLDACREGGVLDVRIIHGKGTGALREAVHSVLRKRADVDSFRLASDTSGWGATVVRLVAAGRRVGAVVGVLIGCLT